MAYAGPASAEIKAKYFTTHGRTKTPEYAAWAAMKARCNNPKHYAYDRYGGRGIKVDPAWETFEAFFADMGPRPSPRHTLEREDNEKGYGPDNCSWAIWERQNRNRRNTVKVEYGGETRALAELCEIHRVDYGNTWRRIFRYRWSVERALTA